MAVQVLQQDLFTRGHIRTDGIAHELRFWNYTFRTLRSLETKSWLAENFQRDMRLRYTERQFPQFLAELVPGIDSHKNLTVLDAGAGPASCLGRL